MGPDQEQEFYVGYQTHAPPAVSKFLRRIVFGLFLVLAIVAILVTTNQKEFAPSTFEYGKLTEVRGHLISKPYPMLRVTSSQGRYFKSLLLVNFGKRGVAAIVKELEEGLDDLSLYEITIKGTLIYYNGKAAIELTEGSASILGWRETKPLENRVIRLGQKTVVGEIVDPKCYLGVMKPGMGKVHQSCARRCISGGIPPLLIARDDSGKLYEVLIAGPNGEALHQEILDKVGRSVRITGHLRQMGDWLVMHTNAANQIQTEFSLIQQMDRLLAYFSYGNDSCRLHPDGGITVCL